MTEFPNRKIVGKGKRVKRRVLRRRHGEFCSWNQIWSTSFIYINFQELPLNDPCLEYHIRHTLIRRGGHLDKFPTSSSMNTLSYCSRKASALELSEEDTRLLDTKAGVQAANNSESE